MSDPFTDESMDEPLASASYTLPPAPASPAAAPAADQTAEADQDAPTQPLYVSPTLTKLAALDEGLLPNPSPACETCPAAMWFTTTEEVKCFCSRMHCMTWGGAGQQPAPVMRCDGRELALMQMAEDLANPA